MIRYALRCEDGHAFDSWFPDSAAYDDQARRGFVECPFCGSTRIAKAIMAPRVAKGFSAPAVSTEAETTPPGNSTPPAVTDERLVALRGMMREVRAAVLKHTTDVGAAFPDQARRMHTGEVAHRPIRGEATPDEARELMEDGVPILPVPIGPDERN